MTQMIWNTQRHWFPWFLWFLWFAGVPLLRSMAVGHQAVGRQAVGQDRLLSWSLALRHIPDAQDYRLATGQLGCHT